MEAQTFPWCVPGKIPKACLFFSRSQELQRGCAHSLPAQKLYTTPNLGMHVTMLPLHDAGNDRGLGPTGR